MGRRKQPPTTEEIARALCDYLGGWEWEDGFDDGGGFRVYVGILGQMVMSTWTKDTPEGETDRADSYVVKVKIAPVETRAMGGSGVHCKLCGSTERLPHRTSADCIKHLKEVVNDKLDREVQLASALRESTAHLDDETYAGILLCHGIDPEKL